MDDHGWKCGWRISDNEEKTLWNAGCLDPDIDTDSECLFRPPPGYFFVIDTHTMKIYDSGPLVGFDKALGDAQTIDALYP
jgi:hypothetical protein